MTSVRCVQQLGTDLYVHFHRPTSGFPLFWMRGNPATCGFQAVVRNTRNVTDGWLATPSKTEICNARTHEKNTTHAIDSILCVRCVFRVHALRTLRQLENQPLSQFSA